MVVYTTMVGECKGLFGFFEVFFGGREKGEFGTSNGTPLTLALSPEGRGNICSASIATGRRFDHSDGFF